MDAGDVELSGAVDFNPNELEEKPKTQEIEKADETVETAEKTASMKEEDVRFYSDSIRRDNDLFVRVEGGERRKRAAARREKYEQKQSLREAKKADRADRNQASKAVVESEKQLKKEQRRIAKEQRAQESGVRRAKLFTWVKKHWYIFAAIVVLAIIAGIIVSVVNSGMAQKAKVAEQFRKTTNYENEAKEIERRMWVNKDGQQPWTAIKEYDDLISRLDSSDLKADAYISRSRLLLDYVTEMKSSDEAEIMRQLKSDAEKATEYEVSDQAVCWARKLGQILEDNELFNKYNDECENWAKNHPNNSEDVKLPDNYEGGIDG